MKQFRLIVSVLSLFIFSMACSLSGAAPTVEPALLTAIPTQLNTAGSSTAPTQSPTQAGLGGPQQEVIAIFNPGAGSSIVSPVTISGEADSTFEQNLVISITDENGNQIAISPTTINAPLGQRGTYSADISFAVGSPQPGRISIYSISAMSGSLEHLSSVELQLLPSGSANIAIDVVAKESIAILQPQALSQISGGTLEVKGFSQYFFESSLGIALCGAGASGPSSQPCGTASNVIATGVAMINSPDIGQPGPFSGSLSYSITANTPGHIVLYATSPRDGGIIHLSSIPVEIQP